MLSVTMLNAVMLCVTMLNVTMLNVAAEWRNAVCVTMLMLLC